MPPASGSQVGIDTVTFPTFGWDQVVDLPTERGWMSDDGTYLSVHFFPVPPDLPSLDANELQPLFGTRQLDDGSRPLLIELAVEHGGALPLVRVISRQHVPERGRYAFTASLIAPLAACSWVVKAGRLEGDETGLREALAFAEHAREHPDRIAADRLVDFDPYGREWDDKVPDALDPLSAVRRCLADVRAGLAFEPEVASQPPFAAVA